MSIEDQKEGYEKGKMKRLQPSLQQSIESLSLYSYKPKERNQLSSLSASSASSATNIVKKIMFIKKGIYKFFLLSLYKCRVTHKVLRL